MVNPITLAIVGIAIVAFFALDGVKKTGEFVSTLRRDGAPIIGSNKKELKDSSATEVRSSQGDDELLIGSIASRSGKTTAKASIVTTQQKPKSITVLSAAQSGAIAGKSNISTGETITLSSKEISDLRKKPFTAQEQADALALTARLNKKDPAGKALKASPVETILQKREQELISKKVLGQQNFFGNKLFANPDFPLTPAEKKARGL